jgi:hypothetical protein
MPTFRQALLKNLKSVRLIRVLENAMRANFFKAVPQTPSRTAATRKGTTKWAFKRSRSSLMVLKDPLNLSFPAGLVLKIR